MKITLKFGNEIKTYKNIKDAEKFLNEALYYCDHLELVYNFEDAVNYQDVTSLSLLQREANLYGGGFINVYQIFE